MSTYQTKKLFFFSLAATLLITFVFTLVPKIDLFVSGLFFDAERGFFAAGEIYLRDLRARGILLTRVIAIILLCLLALKLVTSLLDKMSWRPLLFLTISLAAGPGILINALLKENWGRARPRQLEIFGGDLDFSPVWIIADQCKTNCSFVSGEASASFWLVALAFITPRMFRTQIALATLAIALAASLNRVAFGGHFLSDVMLAWSLTLTVITLCAMLILKDD